MINFDRFPGNKRKILTMSYDDGKTPDRKLVDIFNRYNIRGTFHLNAGYLDNEKLNRISANEVRELYKGHEISAHGFTHQSLGITPKENMVCEIIEDRKKLEKLAGYPVRGMSYPNGSFNEDTITALKICGIEYCRMMETTKDFGMPKDFLLWQGTCHHKEDLLALGKEYLELPYRNRPRMMYVWGHANEFDRDDNWSLMEDFCKMMSNQGDFWYATNIEIVDYMNALKQLRFSADLSMIYNPTAMDVVISKNEEPVYVPSGKLTYL